MIDLRARNFVHAKTSLCARCAHTRHRARNLSSPELSSSSTIILYPLRNVIYIEAFYIEAEVNNMALQKPVAY